MSPELLFLAVIIATAFHFGLVWPARRAFRKHFGQPKIPRLFWRVVAVVIAIAICLAWRWNWIWG